MNKIIYRVFISLLLLLNTSPSVFASNEKASLGQLLFFDKNLSLNKTQSCATCHDPAYAFTDKRGNGVENTASLGDDGKSLGDRNAPTVTYAMFSPKFHQTKAGKYVGGQFYDGRSVDLAEQAGGPFLNPLEMAMPDKASVIERVTENEVYVERLRKIYGEEIVTNTEKAYAAVTDAIAAFEKTDLFAPFDSKYDRHLRGEYQMTSQEELGMTLFFSQQFTNCNICHQLEQSSLSQKETFSNYEYHNIGVPVNHHLREKNGMAKDFVDKGLLEHPQIDDQAQAGKYRVPTLRNVAVTGPYMHNGIFQDLHTVMLFYNKYNSRSEKRQINSETGERWREPELAENLSMKELETGPALDDKRINALVAFLKTLTDKRYEHLLQPDASNKL